MKTCSASKLLTFTTYALSFTGSRSTMATHLTKTTPYSIAFVTVPTEEVAKKIAQGLVKNELAACVNIIPSVTSVYMWKGEVNEDKELILKIKTKTDLTEKLTDFVRKNHPYEVCEVISVPIQSGNPAYLSWIDEVLPTK